MIPYGDCESDLADALAQREFGEDGWPDEDEFAGVEVEVVVCNGKCRKHAVDPGCPLHNGGRA